MKKLAVLGLSGLIGLSVASTALAQDNEPSSIIEVGANPGTVYELPWEEAQKQFIYHANTAPCEDAWICDEDDGRCYDIGQSEKFDEVSIKLDGVTDLLKRDKKYNKKLKFVHIHPKAAMEKGKMYPPSPDDVLTLARLEKVIKDDLDSELDAEVYDGDRIWSFDISEDLGKNLRKKRTRYIRGKKHVDFPYKLVIMLDIYELKKETANNLDIPTIKERADKYVEGIKEQGVSLSYKDVQ